jgi:serine/threonine-protein kinase
MLQGIDEMLSRTLLCVGFTAALVASARAADTSALPARNVLRQYCHRCHHGTGSEGGDFDMLKAADLGGKDSAGKPLVVPKQPGASHIIQRILKQEMPPSSQPRPRPEDIANLWNWIESGAPPFPAIEKREPVSLTAVLETATQYVSRKVEKQDRPFQRFFTLHQLYNHPQVSESDLRLYRAGLSKALNSVSRAAQIVVPKALDKAETLFAVDLRDLNWGRDEEWDALLSVYPYGLTYGGHPDEALRRADEALDEATHCDQAIVRADWFIATATRPPLYHTLLKLPTTARQLERDLGIDLLANFESPKPERIARAAFDRSGVSGQNRIVERHGSGLRMYWKSYDFKAENGRGRLTRFPLGPLDLFPPGKHPFAAQAFEQDGGELIFALPNGLHAYLLVNGKGDRIDAGPIAVVSDPLKTSGTNEIVTGVSCIACHKHGVVRFQDELREDNSVFGDAEKKVRDLYPPQADGNRLLDLDEGQYLQALEWAIGPFLRVGTDKDRPIRDFPEPVGDVARQYRLGFIDAQTAACELDLADPKQLGSKIGEKKLKQLGLGGLLERGEVVSRPEWESVNGVSLMQEVARELRATPVRRLGLSK